MVYENKSLDELFRLYLIAQLTAGGVGSNVVVTNFPASVEVANDSGNPLPTTVVDTRQLTERMLAKAPASGYALWLDTANAEYIYVAEAPIAADGSVNTFNGIRITKDANGNPLGKVSYKTGFIWDNRASVSWP